MSTPGITPFPPATPPPGSPLVADDGVAASVPAGEALATAGPKYPGVRAALDGTGAVVAMETAASEAAGAYPITPSTQMGEGWAQAVAEGKVNVNGRRLLFFEPEGEHAAAAVTAGMSMTGLRATNFSSGQGIVYMHESLYPAVGKRLTYVLNVACRAITKHALNVHAGHDDYHAVDDTGFFQLFAKDAQEGADLNLIAHRVAELALNPGICAQDGFLTSHVIESVLLPERDLIREYLGDPADLIDSPTPAQRLMFGERRRRIPELFDLDAPALLGAVQNQDSYAQGVAAQRPYFFDHVAALTDQAMAEYAALTGRRYARATGYRCDDAELVIVGQGSVVANAEAVADWLRAHRGLRVGVFNLTMFRPFPSDLVVELLAGKRAVVVLERTDQPLAVDQPLLRELRAAFGQAVEAWRERDLVDGNGAHPPTSVPACTPDAVPDFFSGCFGLGSRDLQPGDLVAAVENALPGGAGRRRFYLGVDFVRGSAGGNGSGMNKSAGNPRLAAWNGAVASAYPEVGKLSLPRAESPDLLPEGAVAVRIHSIGGWGAITMGKNLTMTLFDLIDGLHVKSNPKYGSEKKGQPTTFYAVFAREPVRTNCELERVDVVLSPDPAVFRHSDPLAGLADGGVFVIQGIGTPEQVWASFPAWAQQKIRDRRLKVFCLDAFAIARAETDQPDLQLRMQGAAFQGAFFKASPVTAREGLTEEPLFAAITAQLEKKFGHRGRQIVEDNLRVIRRGHDEVQEIDWRQLGAATAPAATGASAATPAASWYHAGHDSPPGVADADRFACQVCATYADGQDPLADPFAALSAIPAATGALRDMSGIRVEVPRFVAELCSGCGQCWTQCPDAAIPGLVLEVESALAAAASAPGKRRASPMLRALLPGLAEECRRLLRDDAEYTGFESVFARAWANVLGASELTPAERDALDTEGDGMAQRLADLPLARTNPFFTLPERREAGSGGLLSITINPFACKGCNLCVEVCPDHALVAVPQDEAELTRLRRGWALWQRLPDTPDRYLQVTDLDQGIGVLHTLLLKKGVFQSMVGGDGSCMGCGEKTVVHLVLAAAEAAIQPRVKKLVTRLEGLVAGLQAKADALTAAAAGDDGELELALAGADGDRLVRLQQLAATLEDLHWRYTSGPGGRGRAALGITNSTGCSSVWGSTYPYNPYPYPWVNHLFQDAPSIGIGIFEGLMRKMADAFGAVRRAELELSDAWDPATHEPFFTAFDWQQFDDDEHHLCPPLIVIGGDGAMLDIGFQNVSRLLASGKPLKVVVLDTQVYSNTGGQACTSGFLGQVSDMAAWGPAQHGKREQRKEMGLLAMAHRGAYVLQSSAASPAHLIGGVLRGLASRRPALFNLYTPCQAEHGVPDSGSAKAARLALESRAFPCFLYDPDAGEGMAARLSLDGNPAVEETWPTYELEHVDADGKPTTLELPLTTADWAATEPRFQRHFRPLREGNGTAAVALADFLPLGAEEREGKTPFIHVRGRDGAPGRLAVSAEMVALCEDRQQLWDLLREYAGVQVPPQVRRSLEAPLTRRYEKELVTMQQRHATEVAELQASFPQRIVRRLAEALVRGEGPFAAPAAPATSSTAPAWTPVAPRPTLAAVPSAASAPAIAAAPPAPAVEGNGAAPAVATAAVAAAAPAADEPWIDSPLCTSCDECIRINPKLFAYDGDKRAYVKDPTAGTFKQLVQAAERCTARIIHPGTPLDADEPDLATWLKRAEPFA